MRFHLGNIFSSLQIFAAEATTWATLSVSLSNILGKESTDYTKKEEFYIQFIQRSFLGYRLYFLAKYFFFFFLADFK
ncbi:hypothetical protein BpHYR1_004475 [Brachionus plicatilis]|uniref:Uncharacterized protein n=1 Tax=Brachionus plicatilis TaxID=10195 RepID=A0A3M7SA05_BRAPC|nr:hypothetical protein BpHYR1_004475 [Brachionus plicatilis]